MELLLPGFCAALILVGIHVYLGIHVIERGVIFVDLAMAQSAALGTMVGFLICHQGPDHPTTYLFSLGFTLLHAVLFAAGRAKSSRIPDEAVIGLTYAILSAMTILLIDRAPHGAERIRDMLAGQVLWVSWKTVAQTAILYGVIGLIHFFWRRRFFLVSKNPKEARKQGISVAFWDFVFYATFGVIITSSVSIGGVLLVFTLLVAPALFGFMYATSLKQRLLLGYVFGFLVTLGGFLFSYRLDLPTGATVVALFGAVLFPLGLIRYIRQSEEGRGRRAAFVSLGTLGSVGLVLLAWQVHTPHPHTPHKHPRIPRKLAQSKPKPPKQSKPTPRKLPSQAEFDALRAAFSKAPLLPKPRTTTPRKPLTRPETPHSHPAQAPRTRPKQPHKPKPTTNSTELQALLKTLEGHNNASLQTRKDAFTKLCRLTKGALPACPFHGPPSRYKHWLQQRALWMRKALKHNTPTRKVLPPTTRPNPPTRPSSTTRPTPHKAHPKDHTTRGK